MHNLACTVQLVNFCGTRLSKHTHVAAWTGPFVTHITCTSCRMWTRSSRKSKSSTKHNTYHPRWYLLNTITLSLPLKKFVL
jgi:hypothetical protein